MLIKKIGWRSKNRIFSQKKKKKDSQELRFDSLSPFVTGSSQPPATRRDEANVRANFPLVPICFSPLPSVHRDISTGFPLFSEFPSPSKPLRPLLFLVAHSRALFIPFRSVPRALLSPFTHVPFTCRRIRFHPVLSLNNSFFLSTSNPLPAISRPRLARLSRTHRLNFEFSRGRRLEELESKRFDF